MVQVYYGGLAYCVCTYADYMDKFHDSGQYTYEWIKEDDE